MRGNNVRPELACVIAARPEVVVDHIQQNRETLFVRGIHKTLQAIRSSVRLVNGKERHAIVTPTMSAFECRNRHQLNVRDSKFGQVVKLSNRGIERALSGERSNVQFVHYAA